MTKNFSGEYCCTHVTQSRRDLAKVKSSNRLIRRVKMKSRTLIALGLGAAILGVSGIANAGVAIGFNVGVPGPVYVAPAPVYVAPPPPTYVAYQPGPVVAPVIAPTVVIGWHGGQYWDGHRYWSRHDWYAHRHW
jgi:hypothetical protein